LKDVLFSIVTPSFNSDKYISETINSVISQSGNFRIEYIIIDNFSDDSTVKIVRKYQKYLQSKECILNCNGVEIIYVTEKDSGMYDAINKGFSLATGDIYAWINSDDIYLNGCFNLFEKIFYDFTEICWVKGITSYINKNSTITSTGTCFLYSREWINSGLYGPVLQFIQQDSVFWRSALWKESGGVNASYKRAGDYDLWKKFSEITSLYSVNAYVSCFRTVDNQKSEDLYEYWKEVENVDELVLSSNKILNHVNRYENWKNNYFIRRFLKLVFPHTFHLISVCKDGSLELHHGMYDELQKLL